MAGIPPVLDTDAEDVAWALQTAEALWKRKERMDAIVWLRRAAQAAGEAEDDDRALALARGAAELTDWLTHNPLAAAPPKLRSPPPPSPSAAPTAGEAVDDLLRNSQVDEYEIRVSVLPVESSVIDSAREAAPQAPAVVSPPAPPPPALPSPTPPHRRSQPPPPAPPETSDVPERDAAPFERASRVPSAAEKHAGMLDPWAENEPPTLEREVERPPVRPTTAKPAPRAFEPEEVVTSAPPVEKPVPSKPPKAPPPLPPPRKPPPSTRRPSVKPAALPTAGVDLANVEALTDLPDDAREAFAKAATVQQLAKDEEVSGFALALVLEGLVDLSATIADAQAVRLKGGEMLRARGTIDHYTPLRLIAASDSARVAIWDEPSVVTAFHACPWVEDELRVAGDRFQAEVGITLGPLGDRLDWALRVDMTSRLSLRTLAEHEIYTTRGKPLPELLIVGGGELELLGDDEQPSGQVLRAGDFLFPNDVLRAAPAPQTVRAAKGGALVLFAERRLAQEMLLSCPPLLEIFSGS